jgi:Putative prokaryotic signal transducing protein
MPEDESQNSKLVLVFTNIDPVVVKLARDLLEAGGIETFIFDDQAAQMLGSTVAVNARLMVHAEAADEARDRLKELGFTD